MKLSLVGNYHDPFIQNGILSRSRIIDKLTELVRSRFDDSLGMIRNCSCETHPYSFKDGVGFCEFDFGQRDNWLARNLASSRYMTNDAFIQIPHEEPRTPKFVFAEDGWFVTCELYDYPILNVRAFESLVTILGEYPRRYIEGDVTVIPYNISNFIVYPDYDFAAIWVKYLSDDQLKFVMKCLTNDKFVMSPSDINDLSRAQRKLLMNSTYGISSTQQAVLSAKHLLNSVSPKPITAKDAVEQRAFIMKELNRRNLTIDETPMEL